MDVHVRLLGGFDVVVDGHSIPPGEWRRRSAAALVKLLALSPGRRLRRERVIDALWPDLLVDEAAPRLHKAAHYARTALGTRDAVVLADETVTLLPGAAVRTDVEEFERAADRGDAGTALGAYGGDLLPDDPYEEWAAEPRDRLRRRHADLLRTAGRWADVVAADPLDEEAHLALVRAHVAAGRRSAALRQLRELAAVLDRELGARPGPAAAALLAEAQALPPDEGPPSPRRSTPVPLPATPTVGRNDDRARVVELLGRCRVVTLVGPGGVGKTRLGVEAALEFTRTTGREAYFADLTRVADPARVPELVAAAAGLHVGSADTAEAALREALRRRSPLLVLDNFEHVLEAAPLVSRIVAGAPDVTVLATSRARLRIAGEQAFEVAPLPVSEAAGAPAVALFAQAATAIDPDFDLAPHLADVADVCRQVDGLPLAIELAAGHVHTLTPALLRARLGVRLGSPDAAPRDSHPRQRTVPATIDWSLQLLGAAEQDLFAALGVFAGPVPLDAVEQVCGDGAADVVAVLGRLVDQSLVRRVRGADGAPRFRLLELLRERARELLPADRAAALRVRHAGWVTATVERLDDGKWVAPSAFLDGVTELLPEVRAAHADARARGDVRTAARIAAALGTYWHREGHHDDGRPWVAEALAAPQEDDLLAARLHLANGFLEWTRDSLAARRSWDTATALSRAAGSERHLAYALALAAVTWTGDRPAHQATQALLDEGIRLARRVGEAGLTAQALCIQGELTRVDGDDDTAWAAYTEARELAAECGDDVLLSMLAANLGYLAEHRGDAAQGLRLHREALALCWSLGRRMVAAWILAELAGPMASLGSAARGAVLVGAADRALADLGAGRAPSDEPEYDRVVGALRDALGEQGYGRAVAEGARLSLDDAVALALGDPGSSPAR